MYHWASEINPAEEVSLRSASPDNVVIIDTTNQERVIGEVDLFSAQMLVYKEAIYMHQSRQFHVDNLDWERKKAYVRQVAVDYFTDAITKTDIKVLTTDEQRNSDGMQLFYGDIKVATATTGYKKIKFFTHENVGAGKVHLPELEMSTSSSWFELPANLPEELELSVSEFSAGLQGAANLLQNIAPVYMMCDTSDIRVVPMIRSPFTKLPSLFIYDSFPGGIGLSFKLYHHPVPAIKGAIARLTSCSCRCGCPSCVGPILENSENTRSVTGEILRFMLGELEKMS